MTPAKHPELSDRYVWSEILYLDPDLPQPRDLTELSAATHKITWRTRLLVSIVALVALAGALAARYFHLLSRLMN